jgi:hypothetical protein
MSQANAGALSGAATGAAAGAPYFPPYGAIIGGVLGGVSGFMSGGADDDAEKEQEEMMEYQAALAQVTARAKAADIIASKEQARHKNTGEMRDLSVAFMKQRANAVAGAGESGVAGGSVQRTITDQYQQEAVAKGRGKHNIKSFNENADRAIAGVQIGLAGQVNEYQGVNDSALMGSALLDVASAGLAIAGTAKKDGWFK